MNRSERKANSAYDVIVIGAGHNGLVAAAYLARAGRKVLVLERRGVIGGAAVSEQVFPGFTFSVFSYVVSLLRPEIIRDLELPRHGLHILPLESTVVPLPNGDYLASWADGDLSRRELYRHSPHDAEAMSEFGRLMVQMAKAVKPILGFTPPDPTSLSPRELRGLLRFGGHLRSLGTEQFHALYKLMTMSSADYLDEWFEFGPLKATKSASGIIGTFLGPRSPGSAYVLLHHYMGEIDGAFRAWGFCKGGNGTVSAAIASAAVGYGATIRVDSAVKHVLIKGGRANGVVLQNGDEYRAPVVVSGLDARRTYLELVDHKELPTELLDQVRRFRFRGSSGKVNLALSALPDFTCMPGVGAHHRGAISISPSIDYLERAYDDAKYGSFSRRPYMDVIFPVGHRSQHGTAGPTRGEHLRAVRALQHRWRLDRREARGFRRCGDRHAERVRTQPEVGDPASTGADASGHRTHRRLVRGKHLPGRTRPAAALLPASGRALGELPHAGARLLPLRRQHSSGRRRDGRGRASGGDACACRPGVRL